MKNWILLFLTLTACEGSSAYREKHGQIKSYEVEFKILSIRVDDDSEYHITAVSPSGMVKSISDADFNGYQTGDDIKIYYRGAKPVMMVEYSDYNEAGYFAETHRPYHIYLPNDYRIETFND